MKQSLFLSELKQIITNKKVLIPIIAVLFVPVLYAGMFLWSFWDPYDHLVDLPVAVVNEDTGANFEGETLALGDELVDKLKDNDQFQFHFVSKKEGYRDLQDQKYYMLVEIPKDFSEHATTLLDKHPKKLQLKYVPNESYNFLSSQIGETAVKEIKMAISSEITATYAENMFDKLTTVADGMQTAADGAGELHDGTLDLKDGTHTLKSNLETLAGKSIEFSTGADKAKAGVDQLAGGTYELADGMNQLTDGSNQLLTAAKKVQSGAGALSEGAGKAKEGLTKVDQNLPKLAAGTEQVKSGVKKFQTELPKELANAIGGAMGNNAKEMGSALAAQIYQQQTEQLKQIFAAANVPEAVQQEIVKNSPTKDELQTKLTQNIAAALEKGSAGLEQQIQQAVDPTFNQLYGGLQAITDNQHVVQNGIHQLAMGSGDLAAGLADLNKGQTQFVNKMTIFNQSMTGANAGANTVAAGASQLANGVQTLADGSHKISDGTQKLADGSIKLEDGTGKLADGSKELYEKLDDAAEKANAVQANDETYDMFGEPVKVKKDEINKVPNYGTGFTPYFLSLGLFVGALIITIVFQLREPAIRPRNGVTWFMSKFGVIALVGILQALLADGFLLAGLHVKVESVPLFILTSIVASLTFMTLIQFLVTLLKDPGRFLAIVILIFQLTTSAGTFPLELIPKVLQPINAILPMTYTVQAFKAVVSSGDYAFMWQNLGVLAAFIVGCMLLTMIYFIIVHRKNQQAITEEKIA